MTATASTHAAGCAPLPVCGDPARRRRLHGGGHLNGIDFVDVGDDGRTLCVHLFGGIPEGIGPGHVRISGGERITGLRALRVDVEDDPDMHDDACLRIVLDREGDHSPYCLCLVDTDAAQPYPGFDPRHACVELRFRLGCAGDCPPRDHDCPVEPAATPEIDYLAKDYEGFRRLFLDRMAQAMPAWRERHVPDIGITLVEALAYAADHLSYYQDAVATEAYLATARRRISVRRHARLVDYRMHEGCNARALVTLDADADCRLPLRDLLLLVPPPGERGVSPGVIGAERLEAARRQGALAFEPVRHDGDDALDVVAAHGEIPFHAWADRMCCLPRGSTRATLLDRGVPVETAPEPDDGAAGCPTAPGPSPASDAPQLRRSLRLKAGDLLLFEEIRGPRTGNPADADPAHRHGVRLTAVTEAVDPLDGSLLLEIEWDPRDALPFDLVLSSRASAPDCAWLPGISVARGNVLLVDHGELAPDLHCDCSAIREGGGDGDDPRHPGPGTALAALREDCWLVPGAAAYDCCRCEGAVHDVEPVPDPRPHRLPVHPLTWAEPVRAGAPVRELFARDPRAALPQVAVHGGPPSEVPMAPVPDPRWRWEPRDDLLGSGPDERHFVVETDDDGIAQLRFGDGVCGRRPQAGDFFRAAPRIGNGPEGNIGRDSIVWLAFKANPVDGAGLRPRNPLPASGGTAAESMAEAKAYAPGAFRARPLRAIVADDYARFAERAPELQGAAGAMAWTGSWYEAGVAVDPAGGTTLAAEAAARIAGELERYRRIGHDVAVRLARYVPLRIEMMVCVRPDFLADDVLAALVERFGSGRRRDGTPAAFHPDNLRLGAPVRASGLVAEAQSVAGVAHVELRTLARLEDGPDAGVPEDGVLRIGPREIAIVAGDPNHPDRGGIRFAMGGGR